MLVIGLVGGIGSGKSVASAMMAELGAEVVNADLVGHEVYEPGKPGFAAIVADRQGRAAVDLGVYGVPETFVIDGKGIIRFKWIGPLTEESITGALAKEIEKARTPL